MNHAFELDADDPDACRLCLLGPLAHNLRAELPDTDIRGAMADELKRMSMMPEPPAPVAAPEAVTETIRADRLTPGRTILIPMTESLETVTRVRVSGSYVTVHTDGTGLDFSYQWRAGGEIRAVVTADGAAGPAATPDDEGQCGQRGRCVQDPDCRWCPFDW